MEQPKREKPPKARFTFGALGRHLIFIAIALVLTTAGFEFWAEFGQAMGNVLGHDKPAAKRTVVVDPKEPVIVDIIPAKPCPKGQKCS